MKLLASIVALSILLAVSSAGYIKRGWSAPVVYYRPAYSSGWTGGSGWSSGGSGWNGGWSGSGWTGSSGWTGQSGGWRGGWW